MSAVLAWLVIAIVGLALGIPIVCEMIRRRSFRLLPEVVEVDHDYLDSVQRTVNAGVPNGVAYQVLEEEWDESQDPPVRTIKKARLLGAWVEDFDRAGSFHA